MAQLLATHYTDYAMGLSFFADSFRLHRDALAGGAAKALDALFGPLPVTNTRRTALPTFVLLLLLAAAVVGGGVAGAGCMYAHLKRQGAYTSLASATMVNDDG